MSNRDTVEAIFAEALNSAESTIIGLKNLMKPHHALNSAARIFWLETIIRENPEFAAPLLLWGREEMRRIASIVYENDFDQDGVDYGEQNISFFGAYVYRIIMVCMIRSIASDFISPARVKAQHWIPATYARSFSFAPHVSAKRGHGGGHRNATTFEREVVTQGGERDTVLATDAMWVSRGSANHMYTSQLETFCGVLEDLWTNYNRDHRIMIDSGVVLAFSSAFYLLHQLRTTWQIDREEVVQLRAGKKGYPPAYNLVDAVNGFIDHSETLIVRYSVIVEDKSFSYPLTDKPYRMRSVDGKIYGIFPMSPRRVLVTTGEDFVDRRTAITIVRKHRAELQHRHEEKGLPFYLPTENKIGPNNPGIQREKPSY